MEKEPSKSTEQVDTTSHDEKKDAKPTEKTDTGASKENKKEGDSVAKSEDNSKPIDPNNDFLKR